VHGIPCPPEELGTGQRTWRRIEWKIITFSFSEQARHYRDISAWMHNKTKATSSSTTMLRSASYVVCRVLFFFCEEVTVISSVLLHVCISHVSRFPFAFCRRKLSIWNPINRIDSTTRKASRYAASASHNGSSSVSFYVNKSIILLRLDYVWHIGNCQKSEISWLKIILFICFFNLFQNALLYICYSNIRG